jgi:hypothetical protein
MILLRCDRVKLGPTRTQRLSLSRTSCITAPTTTMPLCAPLSWLIRNQLE